MVFSVLALLSLSLVSASITDCDTSSVFRPTKLALDPATPVRGQPVTMTVLFDNPGPVITDGTVTTSVTLNYIPFQPSVEALCTNTACPLMTGSNDRSTSSTWPDTVSGSVVTTSRWTGVNGQSLLCLKTSVRVAAPISLRGSMNTTNIEDDILALYHDDVSQKQVVASAFAFAFNTTQDSEEDSEDNEMLTQVIEFMPWYEFMNQSGSLIIGCPVARI
jgi:hypothetical protein